MNYYVIWADGRRFGPADLATLNEWAREGRLIPASQLEETGTGRRFPAHELPGLVFPATGLSPTQPWSQQPGTPGPQGPAPGSYPWSQPQAPGRQPGPSQGPFSGPTQQQPPGSGPLPGYYRGPYGAYPPQQSGSLTTAWVLGVVSVCSIFLCCCSYGILSVIGVACGSIGMFLASKVKKEGYPNAQAAWILNLIGVIVCGLAFVAGIVMLSVFASSGFGR